MMRAGNIQIARRRGPEVPDPALPPIPAGAGSGPPGNGLALVLAVLRGRRLPLEDEKATQTAIGEALAAAGLAAEREVRVTGGIIDVVVWPRGFPCGPPEAQSGPRRMPCGHPKAQAGVGLEVKLKGQPAAILRQIKGYAADPALGALVLVTARPMLLPAMLGGKPLAVVDLGRAWL